MTPELLDHRHAAIVAELSHSLVTRTLGQVADEARRDGESLEQMVDRYEIDFAWQVLGSGRLRSSSLAALEQRLDRPASSTEQASLVAVLAAAAAAQASDVLMSFDNDVAARLSGLLVA